jgi:hypothetical protein
VQVTVAREKKLRGHGRPATGKVVTAQATGIFRQTLEGRAVLMALTLEVQPDGEAAFSAEATVLVGLAAVEKYQAGTLLDVRFDPQDRAHVSVEGRHGVPSSNPEAQARQRHAREQAQHQAQLQAQRAQPNEPQAAQPAWGGPQAPGGKTAPAEFAHVTDMGHVSSVHEHQGLQLLPSFGPPRASVVVRYHLGLAFRTHGPEVTLWRWGEVATIQSNLVDNYLRHGGLPRAAHEYTLTHQAGAKVILDDALKDVETLGTVIKDAVYRLIAPPLEQRYQQGEALAFGPVTIQRQNGLQLEGKLYAWDTIQNVDVNKGVLEVALRDGHKLAARVAQMPNLELLCQLIGVKLDWHDPYRLTWTG